MSSQEVVGYPVFQAVTEGLAEVLDLSETVLQTHVTLDGRPGEGFRLLLKDEFVVIYRGHCGSQQPVSFVRLNFELKFQKLLADNKESRQDKQSASQVAGFKLLNETGGEVSFFIQFAELTRIWLKLLARSLNQMGFHGMFKPVRRLGKGGSAIVYEMVRLEDGARFAAKAFSKEVLKGSPQKFGSFMNEVQFLRNIEHRNLLKLQGVFETDNSYYLLMENLKGGNLLEYLVRRKTALSLDETRRIMRNLMEGLGELEGSGIVHRDIKLENLMFREREVLEPVIVDFGLAVGADDEEYLFYRCGTPGYLSPEVVGLQGNGRVGTVSDVFSAGVVLHTLLMGRYLFEGRDSRTVFANNRAMNFDLGRPEYENVDKCALDLLRRMLAVEASDRITARDCIAHEFLREDKVEEEKMEVSPASTNEDYHF